MTPELSRPINIASIEKKEVTHQIEATKDECHALAERFGLIAVSSLTAHVTLTPWRSPSIFRVEGIVMANVIQTCVVTLDQFSQQITEQFVEFFGPDSIIHQASDDSSDIPSDIPYEPFTKDNMIDLGEVIAQYFFLALDPYPHQSKQYQYTQDQSSTTMTNPFTLLQGGKKK